MVVPAQAGTQNPQLVCDCKRRTLSDVRFLYSRPLRRMGPRLCGDDKGGRVSHKYARLETLHAAALWRACSAL